MDLPITAINQSFTIDTYANNAFEKFYLETYTTDWTSLIHVLLAATGFFAKFRIKKDFIEDRLDGILESQGYTKQSKELRSDWTKEAKKIILRKFKTYIVITIKSGIDHTSYQFDKQDRFRMRKRKSNRKTVSAETFVSELKKGLGVIELNMS